MKKGTKYKNLICFAVVLIVLISITVVPAYADFPPLTTAGRRLGAFLLSAIQAINITLTSTAAQAPAADMINYISDPFNVTYSYYEMWNDKPTIQVWDDYVTIDGVEYTDIWLSNEAASKFQVNAYDFKSAYNIVSNSDGTFASGAGYIKGMPAYQVGTQIRTQSMEPIPMVNGYYSMNDYLGVAVTGSASNNRYFSATTDGFTSRTALGNYVTAGWPINDVYFRNGGITFTPSNSQSPVNYALSGATFVSNPFDFDWVSSTIPAERTLEPDEGLMLRIPSNSVPDLQQFLVDNPEFNQPGGAPIDVDIDPDIMTKLDDLIDIIAPIIPIIQNGDINFTVNHQEPTPPIPDTPIVDATVPQVVNPIINEITNYGDTITEQIPQIIETIPTIDSICENIDTAPYHDLDTGLDHLPTIFLPFITDLRSALGIWHYVTEWLSQISTTFAFVTGCLVGTSIMTPIYAAIAGFMCIKVYRRMTG